MTSTERRASSPAVMVKPGVFLALSSGEGILMDIIADRYMAIDREATAIWKHLADGVSPGDVAKLLHVGAPEDLRACEDHVNLQIDAWQASGLIVPNSWSAPALPVPKPISAIAARELSSDDLNSAHLSLRCAWRLVQARRWVLRIMRRGGLSYALHDLQQQLRPLRRLRGDKKLLCEMVRAFFVLRLPSDQGRSDCLLRSMQLARALRVEGVDADLCFGVQKFPFRAHAWVESDERVLGDTLEVLRDLQLMARF